MHNVTLLNDNDPVRMRITFGHLLVGGYRVHVFVGTSTQATHVASGNNGDAVPDEFTIPATAAALHDSVFVVDLGVEDPNGKPRPGAQWSATIDLIQDGTSIGGAPIVVGGAHERSPQFPDPERIKVN
jgi:hypothetical protein